MSADRHDLSYFVTVDTGPGAPSALAHAELALLHRSEPDARRLRPMWTRRARASGADAVAERSTSGA